MVQKVAVSRKFEARLRHAATGKLSLSTQQKKMGIFFELGKDEGSERRGMGSAFHQLCPRYSGTLTPTAPLLLDYGTPLPLLLLSS